MKKEHIKRSFIEAGMIDEKQECVPSFDSLAGACKRWVSANKEVGVPKDVKQHCKCKFPSLILDICMKEGQITAADMKEAGIPLGTYNDTFV